MLTLYFNINFLELKGGIHPLSKMINWQIIFIPLAERIPNMEFWTETTLEAYKYITSLIVHKLFSVPI